MGGKIKGIIRHFPSLEIPEREDETGPPPPPFLKKETFHFIAEDAGVSSFYGSLGGGVESEGGRRRMCNFLGRRGKKAKPATATAVAVASSWN